MLHSIAISFDFPFEFENILGCIVSSAGVLSWLPKYLMLVLSKVMGDENIVFIIDLIIFLIILDLRFL